MHPQQKKKTPMLWTSFEYYRGKASKTMKPTVRVKSDIPLLETSHSFLFLFFVGAYHKYNRGKYITAANPPVA